MSKDIKKISSYELNVLITDSTLSDDDKFKYECESAIRWIIGTSVEDGKREIRKLIKAWEEDGKGKEDAETLMAIVKQCIERCQRKGLLVPLGSAKKKLEKVL